jgi:nicotinate phosphoribosyltransferase
VGIEPPDIVIKMVECNGQPVAKISDTEGKGMCEDPEFEAYLKKVYQIQ